MVAWPASKVQLARWRVVVILPLYTVSHGKLVESAAPVHFANCAAPHGRRIRGRPPAGPGTRERSHSRRLARVPGRTRYVLATGLIAHCAANVVLADFVE